MAWLKMTGMRPVVQSTTASAPRPFVMSMIVFDEVVGLHVYGVVGAEPPRRFEPRTVLGQAGHDDRRTRLLGCEGGAEALGARPLHDNRLARSGLAPP